MNKVKYNVSPYQNGINKFLDDFFSAGISNVIGRDTLASQPAVNIIEEQAAYRLEFAAPGLQKEDFNIAIDKNKLKVSSSKEIKEDEGTAVQYKSRQFAYHSFSRTFKIPETVDQHKIEASYTNGILVIKLLKKQDAADTGLRKIEIK